MGVEKLVLSIDIHPSSPMYGLQSEGEAQCSPTSLGRNWEAGSSPLDSGAESLPFPFASCPLALQLNRWTQTSHSPVTDCAPALKAMPRPPI